MRTKTDIKLNIINISTIYKNLNKRNQLTDDQPHIKHLQVGGGGEDLPHVDDDCRHHKHRCQVHTQGCFEEGRFEEHGKEGLEKVRAKSTKRMFLTSLTKTVMFSITPMFLSELQIYNALQLEMDLVELQNTCKKLNRKMLERPNMCICYIFEKLGVQGCQR